MKIIWCLAIVLPLVSIGQRMQFDNAGSLKDVISKAQIENKYIFLDCFASWCLPCKKMENDVFTVGKVAEFMNANFISVRVQMDSTSQDGVRIRNWYSDANRLLTQFKIREFPTYLFLDLNGDVLHRDVGAKDVDEFLLVAANALDSTRQYYKLLRKYNEGYRDSTEMMYLANAALRFNDRKVAERIATDIIHKFILCLSDKDLYTKRNLDIILSFYPLINTKCRSFSFIFDQREKVDSVEGEEGLSESIINSIIYKEFVAGKISAATGKTPKWSKIHKAIKVRFGGTYANKAVLTGKIMWAIKNKNWRSYTRHLVNQVDKFGPSGIGVYDADLNDNAFNVFLYSYKKSELRRALLWIDTSMKTKTDLKIHANKIDTKANILYKLGKRKDAIVLEQEASKLDPQNEQIQNTLSLMKEGKPTWIKE